MFSSLRSRAHLLGAAAAHGHKTSSCTCAYSSCTMRPTRTRTLKMKRAYERFQINSLSSSVLLFCVHAQAIFSSAKSQRLQRGAHRKSFTVPRPQNVAYYIVCICLLGAVWRLRLRGAHASVLCIYVHLHICLV